MIISKTELKRAFKFASLAGTFATLTFEPPTNLVITTIHYDNTYLHRALVPITGQGLPDKDFFAVVNIQDVLKALQVLRSNFGAIDIYLEDSKFILADHTLTFELATYTEDNNYKPTKIREDAVIRFYPLTAPELGMFLNLAKTVSDYVHISPPVLESKTYDGDEVKLQVEDYTGEARSTYNTSTLAQIAPFLKKTTLTLLKLQKDGPLYVEIGYEDNATLQAQFINVEV